VTGKAPGRKRRASLAGLKGLEATILERWRELGVRPPPFLDSFPLDPVVAEMRLDLALLEESGAPYALPTPPEAAFGAEIDELSAVLKKGAPPTGCGCTAIWRVKLVTVGLSTLSSASASETSRETR
jgi:hypothetical protein